MVDKRGDALSIGNGATFWTCQYSTARSPWHVQTPIVHSYVQGKAHFALSRCLFQYIAYLELQCLILNQYSMYTHANFWTAGRSIHTKCGRARVGWWNHSFGWISSWQVCLLQNWRACIWTTFEVFQVVSVLDRIYAYLCAVPGLEVPMLGMEAVIGHSWNAGNKCRL